MINAHDVVETALTFEGTPFHHQGRRRGVGLDCVGLIICVAHELGLSDFDLADYGGAPDPHRFNRLLAEHLDPAPGYVIEPGGIVSIAWTKHPMHLGLIIGPALMLHAYRRAGTIRTTLTSTWLNRKRIRGHWRYRGVDYG